VAEDAGYGTTMENPIQVGGGAFDGPVREQAYLDNLRRPDGEAIRYERVGSRPFGDAILDEYAITGLDEPVTLYLDEGSYSPPLAPVGFGCAGPFELSPP
jgi:hypothetical protein